MEDLIWKRSSFCESNGCVEVRMSPGAVRLRNSLQDIPYAGRSLLFTHEEWRVFVAGVKAGEFDLEP